MNPSMVWHEDQVQELVTALRDSAVAPIFMTHYLDEDGMPGVAVRKFMDSGLKSTSRLSRSDSIKLRDLLPAALRHNIDNIALERGEDHAVRRLVEGLAIQATQALYFDLKPYAYDDGFYARSRILDAHPELADRMDDQGLLCVGPGMSLTPWYVEYKKSALHYSPFLRRGFCSNINLDLSTRLAKVRQQEPKATLRVAVDHGRLGTPDGVCRMEERAFWYGPNLDAGWLDDPEDHGVTVHGYENSDDLLQFPCRKLEVRRYIDKNDARLKVIEIEEVIDPGLRSMMFSLGDWNFIPNRYVHAIRDMQRHVMIHFDAAVRFYPRDTYTRLDESFGDSAFKRVKVLRLDGEFSEQTWADIATAYFRDNQLIFEVLGCDKASL